MKKIIVFNGRFLGRKITGVDRFAKEIILAIDEMISANDPVVAGFDFSIFVPRDFDCENIFKNIKVEKVGLLRGQFWEQLDLPRFLPSNSILLNLCNTGPAFFRKQIVVIHDATTVRLKETFGKIFCLWYRILLPLLGYFSRKVLTVSNFSKKEISDCFGIDASKIDVLIEGAEHILKVSSDVDFLEKNNLNRRPFVLAVSSVAVHKNFQLVLDALALMDDPPFDVVIAGGANPKIFGEKTIVSSSGVKWLGYVSDQQLRALYESAFCFVFPSLYEGFGIPPLEAMSCGCVVLSSDAASMPEVCGDAVFYFDPLNASKLADLLLYVFNNPAQRQLMVNKGFERVSKYSWRASAEKLILSCKELTSQ